MPARKELLSVWEKFKKFAIKGNIFDLAIGVIIGGAFGKIVTSLVNDIIMPVIGLLLGGIDFSNLQFRFGKAVVKYGAFIQNVVDFLIISFSIFIFIELIGRFREKEEHDEEPSPTREEMLLAEIRDLLKQKQKTP